MGIPPLPDLTPQMLLLRDRDCLTEPKTCCRGCDAAPEEARSTGAQAEEPQRVLVGFTLASSDLSRPVGEHAFYVLKHLVVRPCKARKVKCGEERPNCNK